MTDIYLLSKKHIGLDFDPKDLEANVSIVRQKIIRADFESEEEHFELLQLSFYYGNEYINKLFLQKEGILE